MPGKSPELYNLKKTAFWFFVTAVVLFASLAGMIFQDSFREWKTWQRKFIQYKKDMVYKELEAARKAVDQKKYEELTEQLSKARADVEANAEDIKRTQREIEALNLRYTVANMRSQNLKQFQDADRYSYEEAMAHGHLDRAARLRATLDGREPDLRQAKMELEGIEADIEAKKEFLEQMTAEKRTLERELGRLTQNVEQLEKQLRGLRPTLAQEILNAPMLDFLAPSLQIQQIVVERLYDDYYFQKVPKVDRCITCHLGIDQPGFENAPQPFRTHPNLELYLGSDSPHPIEKIGCTICHGGSGHSVSFTTAAHTPQNAEQAKAWKKEYNWHPMKHWAEKMLPLNHIEASCTKCHTEELRIEGAPKLNQGRELAQTYGCYGCHKVEGMLHGDWKVGPSLAHVQSKLDPDWIVRWLHDPKEFRESTQMPRIFHLTNTSDPESVRKSNAIIAGMAAYLMRNSEPVALAPFPGEGNVAEGERIFKEIGCLGCHSKGDIPGGTHGPELTHLGSKVKREWLFTWLKNPVHYFEETRMPDFRLTDEQAAHLTAFLLADRNERFESITPPPVPRDAVDDLTVHFLTGRMRHQDALQEMKKMSFEEKLIYIGERGISYYGCFACHNIKGFENASPIGTELSEQGSKEVAKLDFGFIDIPHTRHDWFHAKLTDPRIFDENKDKPYHEKLRMPQFDFTEEEVSALTTFLLSLQKAYIPMEMHRNLTLHEKKIEEGRVLVEKYNCAGCHTLDGQEGLLKVLAEDIGNAPPDLAGEGRKVQSKWLYHFLNNPVTIRPWLQVKMPTFPFKEKEVETIVRYFHHLDDAPVEFTSEISRPGAEELEVGRYLFEAFQCIKCHKSDPDPALSASFLAPDLVISKERLRPDWVLEWMQDPQELQPGTMMPDFFPDGETPLPDILQGDAMRQIKAIRDYLWHLKAEEARALAAKS